MKLARGTPWPCVLLVALTATLIALPAWSYLAEYASTSNAANNLADRWGSPAAITYTLNPNAGSNVQDQGTRSVAAVIQSSFQTWTSAPNTTLVVTQNGTSSLTVPTTSVNLIAFSCTDVMTCDFAKEPQTLALTLTRPNTSGVITSANIFFNQTATFTTVPGNANNTAQDLQTVATHEIGHFFGLDHSGIVRAIMFPFAPTVQLQLSDDDVAGIESIYAANPDGGSPACPQGTGRISGTVSLNGAGVFGAHVFAESVTGGGFGGAIRHSPISTFTKPGGGYMIACIPPDSYNVTAEPADLPLSTSDVDWGSTFGQTMQTNFTTRWH